MGANVAQLPQRRLSRRQNREDLRRERHLCGRFAILGAHFIENLAAFVPDLDGAQMTLSVTITGLGTAVTVSTPPATAIYTH